MRLLEYLKGWWVAIWLKRPSERVRPKPPSRKPEVLDLPRFHDKYEQQFIDDPKWARFSDDVKGIVQDIRDAWNKPREE
jgi:hypothetical protein